MHAYAETYLPRAQKNMGEAFDYAANACGIAPDLFLERFIASGLASEWEQGSPRVLAGLSGTEIVRDSFSLTGEKREWPAPQRAFDLSREYWAGWCLAHYQWWSGRSFRSIVSFVRMSEIISMYNPLHEESEGRFVDRMEEMASDRAGAPVLLEMRKIHGWSQTALAQRSGVNVRSIRQYEQIPDSISKAEAATVAALAKALGCGIEDLLPPRSEETE